MTASSRAVRILIVDDDFLFADMLPRLLRKELMSPPLEIVSTKSPEDAFRHLDAEPFDVVLCDYDLKAAHTGVEVLRRAAERKPAPLRVLISGHTPREIGSRMEGAIDAFVEKPMTLPEVVPVLARLLSARLGVPFEMARRPIER